MTAWKLKGRYFESCSCDAVCPCLFLSPPTQTHCKALLGWQIEKGHAGEVKLDGLNVALWLHAPGPLTEGNFKVALYLDERASDAQKDALTELWQGKLGGHLAVIAGLIGEVVGVYSTKIDIDYADGEKSMTVGDYAKVKMHPLAGADGSPVVVENVPLSITPGHPITVHHSDHLDYDHAEQYSHGAQKSALAANFSYQP